MLIGGTFYNFFGFFCLLVIQRNLLHYIQKIIPIKQIKKQPNKNYVTDASSPCYNSFGFSCLLVIQRNLLLYIQKIIPTKQIKRQPNKNYATDASSSWKGYLEEKVLPFLLFCIDIHKCS